MSDAPSPECSTSLFSVPWQPVGPGAREKRVTLAGQTLRLLELGPDHKEDGFCTRGHAGLMLEGTMTLRFERGDVVRLSAGDALALRPGAADAHKGELAEGETALLLLVEGDTATE